MSTKPCPFCGSNNLLAGHWSLDGGEVDAWECQNCFAGAPVDSWNKRADDDEESVFLTGETGLLVNFDKYGFSEVVCGFIEPSSTFDPKKKLFCTGDGRSLDVSVSDIIPIELSTKQKRKLFPLCY